MEEMKEGDRLYVMKVSFTIIAFDLFTLFLNYIILKLITMFREFF